MFVPTYTFLIFVLSLSELASAIRHPRRRLPHKVRGRPYPLSKATGIVESSQLRQLDRRATTSGWNYVDCVNDGTARALTGYSFSSSSMTVEMCLQACVERGYTYAGAESGNQCYCGNALSNNLGTVSTPSSCTYTCAGDKTEQCGGGWKMSLYKKSPGYSTTSLGCYKDGTPRLFTGASTTDYKMTQDICAAFCYGNGYGWFGVEYGSQCFCSSKAPSASQKIADSSCNSKCGGDNGTICGGSYALSAYAVKADQADVVITLSSSASASTSTSSSTTSSRTSTTTTVASTTKSSAAAATSSAPVIPGVTSLGCFADSATARLLTGPSRSDSSNNPQNCATWCGSQGYKYSGVEYGYQCFCGNSYNASLTKSDASCSTPCTGSSTTKCGGSYAMNVYLSIIGAASSSVSSTASASVSTIAPGPALPSGLTSLGCYQDSSTTRILAGPWRKDYSMTPVTCATWCASQGYKYMGLEYGVECYCGSAAPPASSKVDASRCTTACIGNSSYTCGGNYLANVYSIVGSAFSTTSSSVTTTARTSVASSATTTPTGSPTIGCNAACTSVVGTPSIPSSGRRQLWAHHMVGNTYSYDSGTWQDDISQASAAGFDGFALNHGSSSWQFSQMDTAYAVASAQNFKLFLSIDVTAIGCGGVADAQTIAGLILRYANYTAQATVGNKTLVSTFSGDGCYFGQSSVAAGWNSVRTIVKGAGRDIYLVPAIFVDPNSFSSMTWFDGLLNWDSGWPMGSTALTTASDTTWMSNLGGRTYMPAITPLFFTYYGTNSWNKNWIYRSDDWLLARRFEEVISMRDKVDMAELISWNDYGESHYVGPIRADQPNSQGWVDGFPHTDWLPLINYYASAFKYGSYPRLSTDTIWLWSRPHFKAAVPTAPTNDRPNKWDYTDDNLYVLALLSSPATVSIHSGSNVGTWSLNAGVNKLSIASDVGTIGATLSRNGKVVKTFDSAGQFNYTDKPVDYNYNYWLASL